MVYVNKHEQKALTATEAEYLASPAPDTDIHGRAVHTAVRLHNNQHVSREDLLNLAKHYLILEKDFKG